MKYNLRKILVPVYADERKVKISLQNDKVKQPMHTQTSTSRLISYMTSGKNMTLGI
jgi:hypothetical protein